MVQIAGFLIVFVLLLLNLAPSIYMADSPLFSTASFYLSTAHPPGYPLFITLGKLFTFIPAGSVGYRINLVSALASAFSYLLMFAIINRLTGKKALAFSFSFLPILAPVVFSESLKGDVFTLNVLFCLTVFYLGMLAYQEKDVRFLYVTAFLFGLGAGAHHTLAFLGFPVLVPVAAVAVKERKPSAILPMAVFFLAGFLINVHLYLRTQALQNYGFIFSIVNNWHDFTEVFLRRYYATSSAQALQALGSNGHSYLYGIKNVLRYVIAGNLDPYLGPYVPLPVVTVLCCISLLIFLCSRKKPGLKLYMLLALMPWLVLLPKMTLASPIADAHNLEIVARYYLPLIFFAVIVMASGAGSAYGFLKRNAPKSVPAARIILLLPLMCAPVLARQDISSNFLAYDRGRDQLTVQPLESVYLSYGDMPSFTEFYMQWVERYREDVLAFSKAVLRDDYIMRGRALYTVNRVFHDKQLVPNPVPGPKQYLMVLSGMDELALRGKLTAVHPDALTTPMKERYGYSQYGPLVYTLFPKGHALDTVQYRLRSYPKLNYERVASGYMEESFASEIKNNYGYALLFTAAEIRDAAERDNVIKTASRLVAPEKFFPNYIFLLRRSGDSEQALPFLRNMERQAPDSKTGQIAHVMDYILLKEAADPSAEKAYAYLRANGLLIYLQGVETTYQNMMKQLESAKK